MYARLSTSVNGVVTVGVRDVGNNALDFCRNAIKWLVRLNAVDDLAWMYNLLGAIYNTTGNLDATLEEYRDAISYAEPDGNLYLAALTRLNPAIAPLSAMAVGLTKAIASRRKNVPVQYFYLGLDFGNNLMSARLAEGIYIAVQISEKERRVWDWSDWVYDATIGLIVNDSDRTELIPHNYIACGITCYEGQ